MHRNQCRSITLVVRVDVGYIISLVVVSTLLKFDVLRIDVRLQ